MVQGRPVTGGLGSHGQELSVVLGGRGLVTGQLCRPAGAEETVRKMESTARASDVPPWFTDQMAAWRTRFQKRKLPQTR